MKQLSFSLQLTICFGLAFLLAGTLEFQASGQSKQSLTPEEAYEAGNRLILDGKYSEAFSLYQEGLAQAPEHEGLLYNAAMAAYRMQDYETAAELWLRLADLVPYVWQVHERLVQVHQALGDQETRDAVRKILFTLREEGINKELNKKEFYIRDKFEVNGRSVVAAEYFELKGERALRYRFVVSDEKAVRDDFYITLGSYDMDTALAIELGIIKKGERRFHLDGYFRDGSHSLFGFYHPEPSYDEIREKVIEILQNYSESSADTVGDSQ